MGLFVSVNCVYLLTVGDVLSDVALLWPLPVEKQASFPALSDISTVMMMFTLKICA